jgi:anaerobic sulfite reductase subunit B
VPSAPSTEETAPERGFVPALYKVVASRRETTDVVTLSMEPVGVAIPPYGAGQFNMLSAFGVGEVAISISSEPGAGGTIEHTVRDVGAVSHALCSTPPGGLIGVRGPFGRGWGVEELSGQEDVVVVAGGIGLAPLRGAVRLALARLAAAGGGASPPGRLAVLLGARSPDQVVFGSEIDAWRDAGAQVELTVDAAPAGWTGRVGVVTTLVPLAEFDPLRTVALVCGPEAMMRFTVRALLERGVSPERVLLSLERNMQCGLGVCGHCQLGPLLLCRDGPVVRYCDVSGLMMERER